MGSEGEQEVDLSLQHLTTELPEKPADMGDMGHIPEKPMSEDAPPNMGTPEKRMSEEQPPNSKTMRYDRQLRLWGDTGQQKLELASVCLFNATAIGCETLKSLVLPGVGTITIVDDTLVTKDDVQTNFFLSSEDVGKNRGECVAARIGEMNDDVKITPLKDPFLSSNLSLIKSFSLIIISNTNSADHAEVSQIAWDRGIPVLIVNCIGMYSEVRVVVKEHCVVESKPDNPLPDLRLDTPFTELIEYYQNIDFEGFTDTEHAHIPFVVILLKCLDQWRSEHGGIMPQNYKEKLEFKKLITAMKRKQDEENFNEACLYVNKCVVKQSVSSEVQAIFNECNEEQAFSQFWITACAVKQFYNVKGVLPLSGTLDDMTADSQSYIALQTLYRNKALSDARIVTSYVDEILKKKSLPETFIAREYIESFSKNARFLRLIRTSPVQGIELEKVQAAVSTFFEEVDDASHVWLLFKALHTFYKTYDRYPGNTDGSIKTDEQLLLTILISIQKQYKLPEVHPEGLVKDFVRYGGIELPSVAAYCGGIAAHEAIKLLTEQYVPLDNCLVYNGGSEVITVMKF